MGVNTFGQHKIVVSMLSQEIKGEFERKHEKLRRELGQILGIERILSVMKGVRNVKAIGGDRERAGRKSKKKIIVQRAWKK